METCEFTTFRGVDLPLGLRGCCSLNDSDNDNDYDNDSDVNDDDDGDDDDDDGDDDDDDDDDDSNDDGGNVNSDCIIFTARYVIKNL